MAEHQPDGRTIVQSGVENPPILTEPSEFSVRSVLVLAASSLSLFCSVGFLNAFGVFQAYYTIHYLPQLSDFQISWIGSFAIFMVFGCGPVAGYLCDKFGPTLPIGVAVLGQLVSIFMISLCREYYQFFLAQGVLLGFSMCLLSITSVSVTPLYFQRNRGLAQGVTIAGSSLGGVIWPIVLDQLLNHDQVGFGWTLRILGFIQIPLLAIVLVGIRRPSASANEKEVGSDNSAATEAVSREGKERKYKNSRRDLSRLRHPTFYLMCGGLAIFYFGFFAPLFFVTTYAISIGTPESLSIYLLAMLNAASLFGRVIPGFVADRFGHFNILICSMFGSCIVVFSWNAVTTTAGLIVWSIAYGFISGAVLSTQYACASLIATKEIMGVTMGILVASIALTGLFGTPIAGELVKSGYLALSMFAGAAMLVGAIFLLGARLAWNRKLLAKV